MYMYMYKYYVTDDSKYEQYSIINSQCQYA